MIFNIDRFWYREEAQDFLFAVLRTGSDVEQRWQEQVSEYDDRDNGDNGGGDDDDDEDDVMMIVLMMIAMMMMRRRMMS